MKRVNYLNNRDILAEIHKSKNTFCSYTDDDFAQYDIILPSIDKINIRTIADAKRNQAKRLGLKEYEARKEAGEKVKILKKTEQLVNALRLILFSCSTSPLRTCFFLLFWFSFLLSSRLCVYTTAHLVTTTGGFAYLDSCPRPKRNSC